MKVDNSNYDYRYLPFNINNLMLYVLPLFILIRNKKFEYLTLPVISISSILIGGFMLLFPIPGILFQASLSSILYVSINGTLLFGLGVSLVLNNKVKYNKPCTYINYLIGMSVILVLAAIIN
ncbi:UNVERIFIED_CONTAM: hypothetical protein O8I53_08125 [Campylobacter lari]